MLSSEQGNHEMQQVLSPVLLQPHLQSSHLPYSLGPGNIHIALQPAFYWLQAHHHDFRILANNHEYGVRRQAREKELLRIQVRGRNAELEIGGFETGEEVSLRNETYLYEEDNPWENCITIRGRIRTGQFKCRGGIGHAAAENPNFKHWKNLKAAYRSKTPTELQIRCMRSYGEDCPNEDKLGLGDGRGECWLIFGKKDAEKTDGEEVGYGENPGQETPIGIEEQ
ncbi:hypothetical protein B7494_g8106 [Chlorociboria aeruginascens]|nr:hypothetical protein B7494_g8106 [Chlorociboria aeruginascens]